MSEFALVWSVDNCEPPNLAPFWKQPKKRGRPRKNATPLAVDSDDEEIDMGDVSSAARPDDDPPTFPVTVASIVPADTATTPTSPLAAVEEAVPAEKKKKKEKKEKTDLVFSLEGKDFQRAFHTHHMPPAEPKNYEFLYTDADMKTLALWAFVSGGISGLVLAYLIFWCSK